MANSTTMFLLTAYNRGGNAACLRDASDNAYTISSYNASVIADPSDNTRNAVSLDNAYLVVSGGLGLALSADFCIELYLYVLEHRTQVIFDFRPDSTNGWYPYLDLSPAGTLGYYLNSEYRIQSVSPLPLNTWHHLAISRSDGVTRLWVDGVQQGDAFTDGSSLLCGANRPAIGANGTSFGNHLLSAYIRDFRVINGPPGYTQPFTPPDRFIDREVIVENLPAGATTEVSGQAATASGAAADLVAIYDATTLELVSKVVPDATGAWSVQLNSGEYRVTYCKAGCAPITHGPYTITV